MDGSQSISEDHFAGVGLGVYSPSEASRLVGVPVQSIRNWMLGRDDRAPLWESQHTAWSETLILGFRDMMEARIVHALRKHQFSLQELRGTMDYARMQVGDSRPFSTRDFKVAGKDIFLNLPDGILTVSRKNRGQSVFKEAILPILKSVEYGEKAAKFFWPQPRKRTIVLDPEIAFGKPILVESGIPTGTIAGSVIAEGSEKLTAKYFEIPVSQVRDAVKFEANL